MGLLADTFGWLIDPGNFSGEGLTSSGPIPQRVIEHLLLSIQPLLLALVVAFPVGLFIGHKRRFEFMAVTIGNLGRALPSFGILAFFYPITFNLPGELGYWAVFLALFFLAIPPILTNTYVGVKGVDQDTVEAARGMGLSERELITTLEIPIAMPLVIAGVRLSAVQVVATATLGAVATDLGLGRYIVDGFPVGDDVRILGGAVLVAILAIATELLFGFLQRALSPRTSSRRTKLKRLGPQNLQGDYQSGRLGSGEAA